MTITEKIIALRTSKRIKSSEIANSLDIHHSNYLRIEKRDKELTINQLEQIAAALEVTLDDLLHYGEPANSGVNVGTLEIEIKELKRELDLLKKELAVTQKDLSLTKQQTAKKYNGRWLKVTDKDIGLFIQKGTYIVSFKQNTNFENQYRYLVPSILDLLANFVITIETEDVYKMKEYRLYLYFTYSFFNDCIVKFFSKSNGESNNNEVVLNLIDHQRNVENSVFLVFDCDTYMDMSREETVKFFSHCYNTHIESFFNTFSKLKTIDGFISSGLLNLDGFIEKWRYATSKETFFRVFNDYILGIILEQHSKKYTIQDLEKFRYFDND